jgi:hypothetical protein
MAECQSVGEPCTGYHECCTGLCADPGTGVPVCQMLSGCRPIGEVCLKSENCCSGICTPYQDTGIMRCEFVGSCLQPGELCWEGQPTNCCPSGPDGGSELCHPTLLGLQRCFGEGTDEEGGCIPEGLPCSFGEECCLGVCVPGPGDGLICGPCVGIGGACTADADCCDGLCVGGVCEPNYNDCEPIGAQCSADEDCCSGVCDEDNGICTR